MYIEPLMNSGEVTFIFSKIGVNEWVEKFEWQMADGKWQMANGKWQMANGKWQMADGNARVNLLTSVITAEEVICSTCES
jgi:hypothetical protein